MHAKDGVLALPCTVVSPMAKTQNIIVRGGGAATRRGRLLLEIECTMTAAKTAWWCQDVIGLLLVLFMNIANMPSSNGNDDTVAAEVGDDPCQVARSALGGRHPKDCGTSTEAASQNLLQ